MPFCGLSIFIQHFVPSKHFKTRSQLASVFKVVSDPLQEWGGGMGVFVALLVEGVADEVLSHLNVVAFVLMGFTQSPALTTHRTQYARH